MTEIIKHLEFVSQGLAIFSRSHVNRIGEDLLIKENTLRKELDYYEKLKLVGIYSILTHPEFQNVIDEGKVTFAMLRPWLNLGKKRPMDDSEIAHEITRKIKTKFKIIFSISLPLSGTDFENFYGFLKPKLEQIPQEETGISVWEHMRMLMTSGATTIMLLYDPLATLEEGNSAWEKWRKFIGSTNPSQAEAGTIRSDFGTLTNNIVHGSDSIEAVHKETFWLAGIIQRYI